MALEVFISHSHDDRHLAKALVNFLITGVEVDEDEIRCTSNISTGLKSGAVVSDELLRDIRKCRVFIPLVTATSLTREYVAFELGAALALKKAVFPVCHGKIDSKNTSTLLRSRLVRDLSQREHLVMLGNDVGREVFDGKPNKGRISAAADSFLDNCRAKRR